ncbi:MAG TPA: dihydrofolate reductase family protein [Gaiellaceae bacterium]
MGKLRLDISMSLDGFVAGPDATVEEPLGKDGLRLHEWIFGLASWREMHGEPGGEKTVDDEVVRESWDGLGAVLMGRRMFSGGEGGWEGDPMADGWWGDDPPYEVPVFVLTHHAREPLSMQGRIAFTFVTGGIAAALDEARAVAGGKDVLVAGGASVAQQYLNAGLLDELQIHLVPLLLGDGVRLFEAVDERKLELTRVIESPAVTHLKYRVLK